MHHMAMLSMSALNTLEHALTCHKDHLDDARGEYIDAAKAALDGTDFNKFDQVSAEINSLTIQLAFIEALQQEIGMSKRIGPDGANKYQLKLDTNQGPALHLIMENYVEMQYDILRGELLSVTRGELTINPANVALGLLKGEDNLLERTVEGSFLEGYFKALR